MLRRLQSDTSSERPFQHSFDWVQCDCTALRCQAIYSVGGLNAAWLHHPTRNINWQWVVTLSAMVCRLRFIVDMFAWFPFDWIVLGGVLHTCNHCKPCCEPNSVLSSAALSEANVAWFLMPAAFDASVSDNFHRWIGLIQLLRLVRLQCGLPPL